MAGEVTDTIGAILGAYASIETAKINSRFQQSASQPAAYDTPSRPQAVNNQPAPDGAGNKDLLMWGGLALVGLVALVLVTR